MSEGPRLDGLVPDSLRVRTSSILLEDLEVEADIGFHEFEVGKPQKLLVTVQIWVEEVAAPATDDPAAALDYDYVRAVVRALARERRYNLQETLAHAIFDRLAAMRGVKALRIATAKPDVYPDTRRVGIEISSLDGLAGRI